ncbi:MAG: hypothetical protein AAGI72_10355 [Pseudomonadota bacterium]
MSGNKLQKRIECALIWLYVVIVATETAYLGYRYRTEQIDNSDPLSINLGWAGLISMIVMLIYSFARRSKGMKRFSPLKVWLHFHIFCGVQGVLFVFFHCVPTLTAISPAYLMNPGVLAALAVLTVFHSGIFGRYLYSMLPRAIRGEQMSARDVEAELREFSDQDLPPEVKALADGGSAQRVGLFGLVSLDWKARQALRRLRSLDLSEKITSLAERSIRLRRRYLALGAVQPWFELWIVAHRPIAAVMYVLSAVHVALSYLFGN